MALHVFIAHTGERLDADPISVTSLDRLKNWAAQATSIPPPDQVFLTSKGKHVKLQALLTEKEIFLFDRALFTNPTSAAAVAQSPALEHFPPGKPPDKLTSETDLKSWQALFEARRDWALNIVSRCRPLAAHAAQSFFEQANIERALRIATGGHGTHIRSLDQKHAEAREWFDDVAREQAEVAETWERDLERLLHVPAKAEFARFLSMEDPSSKRVSRIGLESSVELEKFADPDTIRQAVSTSRRVCKDFSGRISELGTIVEKMATDYNDLLAAVEHSQRRSESQDLDEPGRLMNEIELVAQKISSDCEHVKSLTTQPRSVTQASKMALLHTRNYLPGIADLVLEMNELAQKAVGQRNLAVSTAADNMQTLAAIESLLANVGKELSTLSVPSDGLHAFETLAFVSRLPMAYGSLLVEAVRRHEWTDKIKRDSSRLAEEIATYREEEERRRKRWLKNMQDIIKVDGLQGGSTGVEINIQSEELPWPHVTRQDLHDHLKALRGVEGLDEAADALAHALKDLDRPTRQQIKHAKAFKMGSVHEATFGKASLMLHGEDELNVLKASNSKLEDELKSQRSRVRKLEDLLHRSTSINRPPTANFNAANSPDFSPDVNANLPSPKPYDQLSRRSSVSSRRFSSNQTPEDRNLTRRILALEEELATERERRADLERNVMTRNSLDGETRRQIEEANSTKKDLMENMEAQQREFATERRALEEELLRYKLKVEEVEDELDRILGSRDTERTGTDNKMRSLVAELDQIRRDAAEEVHAADERTREVEAAMQLRKQAEDEQKELLSAVYTQLSPDTAAPQDFAILMNSLEEAAQRSADHTRSLTNAIAMARSDNEALQSALDHHRAEAAQLSNKFEARGAEVVKAREELAAAHATKSSLASQLEEERGHLMDLRSKFAEGETGSESLRQRVADEEAKVLRLSTELASTKSHVNSLDVELSALQKKHHSLQTGLDTDTTRLRQQSARAKELSRRIYTQNDRLVRLLEALGFAISHNDAGGMLIQRASKAGASTVLSDPSASITTAATAPTLARRSTDDSPDLSVLYWPDKETEEEESAKYAEYLRMVDRFDLAAFSDAVSKRMRDVEHTARKWQKEARSYRERAHRAQAEAHDKIAFRGFRDGDLALFLPTRNQATRPWAAFNVGAPHYFLRETDAHKLHNKEWLVARISRVEERVVDLSKTVDGGGGQRSSSNAADRRSVASTTSDAATMGSINTPLAEDRPPTAASAAAANDNPFELSDGLRWYLLDAAEEKPGAPATPGLGKSTVASAPEHARGTMRVKKSAKEDASGRLNKSLDSRRSSTGSKKSLHAQPPTPTTTAAAAGQETPERGASRGGGGSGVGPPAGSSRTAEAAIAVAAAREAEEYDEHEGRHAAAARLGSRSKSPLKRVTTAASMTASPSKSVAASPSKASLGPGGGGERSGSPSKPKKSGIWDSLWQLDISLESGGKKK